MKDRIDKFIEKQTCASVCCMDERNLPYCFSCFYFYNREETLLHYKTTANTHHAELLLKNPAIAGTILPDKLNMIRIKGVQLTGMVLSNDHPLAKNASAGYYKKYPVALSMPGEIWTIQINTIKFTDNTLGFGTKMKWERS